MGNEETRKAEIEAAAACMTRGQELVAKHFGTIEKALPILQQCVCEVATLCVAALSGTGHEDIAQRIHATHQLLHEETSALMDAAIYWAIGFAEDNEIR